MKMGCFTSKPIPTLIRSSHNGSSIIEHYILVGTLDFFHPNGIQLHKSQTFFAWNWNSQHKMWRNFWNTLSQYKKQYRFHFAFTNASKSCCTLLCKMNHVYDNERSSQMVMHRVDWLFSSLPCLMDEKKKHQHWVIHFLHATLFCS